MMYEFIETIDIDRFTFEIWGSMQGNNGIEEEIEEKLKNNSKNETEIIKKDLIKKVIYLLEIIKKDN